MSEERAKKSVDEGASRFSMFFSLIEFVAAHAEDAVRVVRSVVTLVEKDIRRFFLRILIETMIGAVFFLVGTFFFVFGLGTALVEWIGLGIAASSMITGGVFVLVGVMVLSLLRRR